MCSQRRLGARSRSGCHEAERAAARRGPRRLPALEGDGGWQPVCGPVAHPAAPADRPTSPSVGLAQKSAGHMVLPNPTRYRQGSRMAHTKQMEASLMRHLRLFHRAGPLIVALLTAALLVAPTGAAARTTADTAGLQIVDLGTLGGTSSWARDINDEGQVVGDSQTINDHDGRAFVWRDGRMKQLGTLGGRFSA